MTNIIRRRARGAELYAKGSRKVVQIPRPSSAPLLSQTPENEATWSAATVRAALLEHEEGQFIESSKLIDAMGRDDRITGCLRARRTGLLATNGADFSIEPGETGAEKYVATVDDWWRKVVPTKTLSKLLETMIMAGVAVARVPYQTNEKTWTPGLVRNWPLQSVWYDQGERVYKTGTLEGGTVNIELEDPNWLVLQCTNDAPWMCGAVRALGELFVMRRFNWRDWAKYNERHGTPIIRVYEPPAQDTAAKTAFFTSVRNMGTRGAVRIPLPEEKEMNGYEVDLLESQAKTHDTFLEFRAAIDTSIAIALLGQNLTTEVGGGSLAASKSHMQIRQDVLDGDAEVLGTELRDQIVVPWGRLNFAGFTDEDAPIPKWDTSEEEDLGAKAVTFDKAADAVQKLRAMGAPLDYTKLLEDMGLPVVEGEDFKDPEPAPGTPPEETPPPDEDDPQGDPPEKTGKDAPKNPGPPRALATVASGITAKSDGFIDGQVYVDAVADGAREAMAAHLGGDLAAELLAALDANDYGAMRAGVIAAYKGATPPHETMSALANLYTMAHRAGMVAVDQDV